MDCISAILLARICANSSSPILLFVNLKYENFLNWSSVNPLLCLMLVTGFTKARMVKVSEEDASHPPAHTLLLIDSVELVDELVEIVGRLHD